MNRRRLLAGMALLGGGAAVAGYAMSGGEQSTPKVFPLTLSDEEWRERLTREQYAVLRDHATERPYSSPLLAIDRPGRFHCAGCDQAVFDVATKFDSRTGWPSFWDALPGAIGTQRDYVLLMPRTEEHCSNCGGHLGHIFDDGPEPTGLRHCVNGVAMVFRPKVVSWRSCQDRIC